MPKMYIYVYVCGLKPTGIYVCVWMDTYNIYLLGLRLDQISLGEN